MRAVLQRVNRAAVRVDGEVVGEITRPGLMVLVGATHDDGPEQVATVARKIAELRLSDGAASEGERGSEVSVSDLGAPVLVVSQFTLYADIKSRRPGFTKAAPPAVAIPLYETFLDLCRARGFQVEHGAFGADMAVQSVNDGPVTIWMDTETL